MIKIFLSFIFVIALSTLVKADTTTHVYGKDPNQKQQFTTDWSEIKPDKVPLNETSEYNQALVILGFVGVGVIVAGFTYLLIKGKH